MDVRKLLMVAVGGAVSALMLGIALTGEPAGAASGVIINEIRIDQPSTDNDEYFELSGAPGTSLNGMTYLVIGDGVGGSGVIEAVADLSGQSIPSDGHFLAVESTFTLTSADLVTSLNFENSDNVTHLLVQDFSGSNGDDLDTDDDGTLDATPWTAIHDSVALIETIGSGDLVYSATTVGPDGSFVPGHVFLCSEGWRIGGFTLGADDTPGVVNLCPALPTSTPTPVPPTLTPTPLGPTPTPIPPTLTPTPLPPTPTHTPIVIVPIMDIQGLGHISPYDQMEVTTVGVVTAHAFNGYYIQDPSGDGDPNTSDAMFVFQFGSKPGIGDLVQLTDIVTEFIPGGASTGNLSTTQMSFPAVVPLGTAPIPAPVVIGTSGRVPPAVDVISDDETTPPINLQLAADDASNNFDPANDGIDFYESLEGMLVTIEDPVAISGTRTFSPFSSEVFVLPNNGAHVAPSDARTARGGINLQPDPDNTGDQNPERVQIQFDPTLSGGASVPAITVGDRLDDVTGVVGYSFGNFEVNAIHQVTFASGGLATETSSLVGTKDQVTVASYNVLNLSPLSADDNQRATLASQIAHNLGGPDVIALQEIQDNNGTTDDGTTDATITLQALVDAIAAAGGPSYSFFDVAPVDGSSGGVPGGNIRNAFLYNDDRVKLVDFESLTPSALAGYGVSNPNAFDGTRDPLLATFKFRGKEFTVINNHLTSRFGSTPVFGGPQPFVQAGETEREAQMTALNEVVDALLAAGRGNKQHASKAGRVIVLGDLNTMEFTDDLTEILPGPGSERVLTNLISTLTDDNVYTFNFEGNSQVLDHMLVSDNLLAGSSFDIVHLNVDYPRVDDTVGSDHEPLLALFDLDAGD